MSDDPVGRQMTWVVERLLAGAASEQEISERLDPAFLAQVPAAQVASLSAGVVTVLGDLRVAEVSPLGEGRLKVVLQGSTGARLVATGTVSPAPPHLIVGLLLAPDDKVPEATTPVRVIVLNGASSSGKSTVAKALQDQLEGVWLHVEIDAFLKMVPAKGMGTMVKVVRGAHRAMAALVAADNRLIVDTVVDNAMVLSDLREALADVPILWVGVHCDPDVLDQRERARADRIAGQGKAQLGRVHSLLTYDVEVDTTSAGAQVCAEQVAAAVAAASRP